MPAKKTTPWLFVLLTFAITWALWIPAALLNKPLMEMPTAPLYLLGGFGPSLAAIILVSLRTDRAERRDFWRRVVDVKHIPLLGWLAAFLLLPLATILAVLAETLLSGALPPLPNLTATFASAGALISTLIITLVAGPLSEELGWRGYALDRLLARWSPAAASLVLGLIWWAWHLPLFFIEGTSHAQWGLFTPFFWLFLLNVVPLTFFMTWAYTRSSRSTLVAIIIHFMFNLIFGLIAPLSLRLFALQTLFTILAVTGLVLATGGLAQREASGQPAGARKALPETEQP